MNRLMTGVLTIAVFLLGNTLALGQCAMCKAVVESNMNGEESVAVAAGINSGIIYLMGIPYLLIGLAGFLIYRHYKMNQKVVH